MAAKKGAKNGVSKKGDKPKGEGKKKGKKKKSKSKVHEFTPYEVSLIMKYLLVYSNAKSLAFFKKTYKDLKVDVKKETLSLNSENKQNYEYVRALQEINDQLLGEINDNNLSKKLPIYMNMDEAFTSTTQLNVESSNEGKNENIRHKKKAKVKAKESTTEKTIKNNYKYKFEEQIRNLDEQIQAIIEEIIKKRKYAKQLDEENEKLDKELATIKSNMNNPLDGKMKELNETYVSLIENNKAVIKHLQESNSKKAAVAKKFAEEKMCNIEDGANLMQFESLSVKKQDIYLRNRYLHQLYNMILENIQQLHNNNIRLTKQNELLVNRCVNIDYNGKYLNYDENRLNGKSNCNDLLSKSNNDTKTINFKRVSSTIESIISGETIDEDDDINNEDEEYDGECEEHEEDENCEDIKQISSNIINESNELKELTNNESNINNETNGEKEDNALNELNLSPEELLEQTKIDLDNGVSSNDDNNENDNSSNKNSCNNSKNSLNISKESINSEIMDNDINNAENKSSHSLNNVGEVINDTNLLNENQEHQDNIIGNDNNMEDENEEEVVENLIQNEEMKKNEHLNKVNFVLEDGIDDSIYSKYRLKRYQYPLPSDIHKNLNLKGDDEAMCTRLVRLTNYNLDQLEPYKSKKEKMDTYIIVKNILRKIDEEYKKEQEDYKNKAKWVMKKPDEKKNTFLIEKNEITNKNKKKKEFDSYYDFIDVNDITKIEDINRLTELTIASYDYFKKNNDIYKKKIVVNHNIPNLRLYNRHYGQLVNFKKMDDKEVKKSTQTKNKKIFGNEYIRKNIENEKEYERIQLENRKRHISKLYSTIPLQHPVMSISDKAIVQYNKRKEFNDADIQRLLNYKVSKNRSFNQDLYDDTHINTMNDIIEKRGNKKDILLYSYSDLFKDKNKILNDNDSNLFDENGEYRNILSLDIDIYKKYCNLDPIIEFEVNKALNDKSMANGNFFWFKGEKKPIKNIDIMNDDITVSYIPELMKNSKFAKPPYTSNNLPDINSKNT